ncbi:MAG: hypothetical protein DYG94_02435 [Leptolyngbya sp. PLA3]|nr:MAG: hypothetical protein EDM82_02120 [Cyanobacteria bacterium CYA]MCE7967587.1 hypothetical protein [Leptolyngbya sp. PL-A3]
MSDLDFDGPDPIETPPADSLRPASMRLRDPEERSEQLMDPANQSLAEALRITYRIVQLAMVALAFLFLFSGVQRVAEGERGIPLLFGEPTAEQLDPGLHFSAPFPIGEIVKVDATTSNLEIMFAYWPRVAAGRQEDPISRLSSSPQLVPGVDGSLITSDLSIAHAQWKVEYRRVRHRTFAENIYPEAEKDIVRGAVQRGIVRVVAETPIDVLLGLGDSGDGSITDRIRAIAQGMLTDDLNSGIVIDKVTLYRKTAPVRLIDQFARVQTEANAAGTKREEAEDARESTLNGVAGKAYPELIRLIQYYESAVELGQPERAEQILSAINNVFEGRAAEFEDVIVLEGQASGEVTQIISLARSQATELRESAEADLRIYRAKLAQFRANPRLMMQVDWVSAYRDLTSRQFVQTMLLPEGVRPQLVFNADPDFMQEIYSWNKQQQMSKRVEERTRELQRQRFDTNRTPVEIGE